jgi:hypothetical protein
MAFRYGRVIFAVSLRAIQRENVWRYLCVGKLHDAFLERTFIIRVY